MTLLLTQTITSFNQTSDIIRFSYQMEVLEQSKSQVTHSTMIITNVIKTTKPSRRPIQIFLNLQ